MLARMISSKDHFHLLTIKVSHFSVNIVSWRSLSEDIESSLSLNKLPTARSTSFQTCRR